MLRLPHLFLAAGLLSLSAGGFAQPAAPSAKAPGRPAADRGARQPETRAELKAALEARFDRMDLNHDGKIDEQDAKLRHEQRIARRFDAIDTDHDGKISKEEFAAAEQRGDSGMGSPRFGRHDGERAMMFHREGPEGRLHGRLPFAPPPGGFGHRGGPEGKPGQPLTRAEFVDRGLARFDKVDTDHDGKISPAERDAARASMRGPRGHRNMPPPPPTPPQSGQ